MASKKKLENTGERMIPALHAGELMYAEHVTRYEAAAAIIKDKVVLDIASGSGYGTKMLAEHAKKVYGVDVSAEAVDYAKERFSAKNVEYRVGSGTQIPLEDNSIDVVVTFETIEHIEDYGQFIKEIDRVLKPDGVAIVSTPNDLEFAEGNHFHVHEFTYDELTKLLKKTFKYIDPYFQATWKYVALGPEQFMQKRGLVGFDTENLAPLKTEQCLYFYLVCSRRPIKETEKVKSVAALGGHYSDRLLTKQYMDYVAAVDAHNIEIDTMKKNAKEKTALLEDATRELALIKGSKSYKLALKMSKLKQSLTKDA